MKVKSIFSKPRSKKKYWYYCYECGNKKKLFSGRHWCTCQTPEFTMDTLSPKERKIWESKIEASVKGLGKFLV